MRVHSMMASLVAFCPSFALAHQLISSSAHKQTMMGAIAVILALVVMGGVIWLSCVFFIWVLRGVGYFLGFYFFHLCCFHAMAVMRKIHQLINKMDEVQYELTSMKELMRNIEARLDEVGCFQRVVGFLKDG